jgi:hypothetical protein
MTRSAPAGQQARDDLTPRVFQALFQGFDLHAANGTYIVVPKGCLCLAGPSLGDIARQISTQPGPAASPGTPARDPAREAGTGPVQ